MDAEKYRRSIRRRVMLLGLMEALLFVVMHVGRGVEGRLAGLLLGMAMGGILVGVFVIGRYGRALKDDTLLRRLYNQEHDERLQAIQARAGLPMGLYLSLGMLAAGCIAGLFSETMMLTLVLAAAVQLCVCVAVKMILLRVM
ncbi:MAG: hypothetical protein ACI4MJ_10790 [Aristaeellaceae bacterium]